MSWKQKSDNNKDKGYGWQKLFMSVLSVVFTSGFVFVLHTNANF
jgi:hypothetical protein